MRTHSLLRLAGAASLALATVLTAASPASAWAGLSDKQKAHIETIIHCEILLLTDLQQFNAEQPPCGGTASGAALSSSGGSGYHQRRCEYVPTGYTIQGEVDYCDE